MKICAGIVIYNPEIELLNENLGSIVHQVDEVVIVDNTPSGFNSEKLIYHNVHIINNNKNLGIGRALNQILNFAIEGNFEWFLTLDQDSVCQCKLIEHYKCYLSNRVGQMTCNIIDRHLGKLEDKLSDNIKYVEVEDCITSGCINNTDAIKKVGGFDESMFIDGVDIDISLKLKKFGFLVLRMNYLGVVHSLGEGLQLKIFGFGISLTRHAPWRNYYMRRNFIFLARKYYKGWTKYKKIIQQIVYGICVVLLENKKLERLDFNIRGIIDGLRKPTN